MPCDVDRPHRWRVVSTIELQSEAGFETVFECRDCSSVWRRRVNQEAVLLHKSLLVPVGMEIDEEKLAEGQRIFTLPRATVQNRILPRPIFRVEALNFPHKEKLDHLPHHKPCVTCPCDECVLRGMELDEQLAQYKLA